MAFTKIDFGKTLQAKLEETTDIVALSRWAYEIYLKNVRDLEPDVKNVLLDLARMEDATEFEYSHADLIQMSHKLTSGE